MCKKKITTYLIALIMIFGVLISSNLTVYAAGTGWTQDNGTWYYYENGSPVKDRWISDSIGWCYLGNDGSLVMDGWVKDSNGWVYIQDGYWVNHSLWAKDSNGLLYINNSGYWDGKPAIVLPDENQEVTEQQAILLVKSLVKLDIVYESEGINNYNGIDYYFIHAYEIIKDEDLGTAHTATAGWYYVQKSNGKIYDAILDTEFTQPLN